jgi:hypothetical protein
MEGIGRKDPMRAIASARRAALVQFAVSSAVLLAVVATTGAVPLKRVVKDEALQDARSVTVAFGEGVLREHITPAVLDGDARALRDLDGAVRARVLGRPIVRLKVWSPDGRIVYSDAAPLVGRRFPLPGDLREALADDAVRADVSDLSLPENRFERGRGRLVEATSRCGSRTAGACWSRPTIRPGASTPRAGASGGRSCRCRSRCSSRRPWRSSRSAGTTPAAPGPRRPSASERRARPSAAPGGARPDRGRGAPRASPTASRRVAGRCRSRPSAGAARGIRARLPRRA